MDTLLLVVTSVSLVLVVVLAAIVARLLRDERRRSDARIAALVAMSAQQNDEPEPLADFVNSDRDELFATEYAPPPSADEPASIEATPPGLFSSSSDASHSSASPWRTRMVVIAPLALIVLGVGFAFYPSDRDIGAVPPASTASENSSTSAPLELLSLRHAQQADALTVTGLVQNPRMARPVSQVFATAYLFSADGTFLASGRAPLDFTTLSPGDESPFVVTVPVKGQVARYRIGFRDADGRVIAHVDRRAGGAVARVSEEQS